MSGWICMYVSLYIAFFLSLHLHYNILLCMSPQKLSPILLNGTNTHSIYYYLLIIPMLLYAILTSCSLLCSFLRLISPWPMFVSHFNINHNQLSYVIYKTRVKNGLINQLQTMVSDPGFERLLSTVHIN